MNKYAIELYCGCMNSSWTVNDIPIKDGARLSEDPSSCETCGHTASTTKWLI